MTSSSCELCVYVLKNKEDRIQKSFDAVDLDEE